MAYSLPLFGLKHCQDWTLEVCFSQPAPVIKVHQGGHRVRLQILFQPPHSFPHPLGCFPSPPQILVQPLWSRITSKSLKTLQASHSGQGTLSLNTLLLYDTAFHYAICSPRKTHPSDTWPSQRSHCGVRGSQWDSAPCQSHLLSPLGHVTAPWVVWPVRRLPPVQGAASPVQTLLDSSS